MAKKEPAHRRAVARRAEFAAAKSRSHAAALPAQSRASQDALVDHTSDVELAGLDAHRSCAMLSEVNELALRADEVNALLSAVCNVCLKHLDLSVAWVGVMRDDGIEVLAARSRHGRWNRDGIAAALVQAQAHDAPLAHALRDARSVACNDFLCDPRTPDWRRALASLGTQACLCVPVARTASSPAVIGLHTPAAGFFDARTVALIERAADNVAFALDRLDREAVKVRERTRLESLCGELTERGRAADRAAAQADAELESFAYSVSHDLRAPVRHVGGFAKLLEEEAGDTLDPDARRYVSVIAAAARKLGHLIDDLLTYSRMSRHPLAPRLTPLTPMVRDVIAELSTGAAGRAIDWQVSELPPAFGDADMLRVLLVNLLDNAVKFTRGRSIARIAVDASCTPQGTTVEIRDNGVGFDMAYAGKLFGVFQRLHREEEFEGTGIGLAICRRILQRHGGSIEADASPDDGATFRFTMPHPDTHVGESDH